MLQQQPTARLLSDDNTLRLAVHLLCVSGRGIMNGAVVFKALVEDAIRAATDSAASLRIAVYSRHEPRTLK